MMPKAGRRASLAVLVFAWTVVFAFAATYAYELWTHGDRARWKLSARRGCDSQKAQDQTTSNRAGAPRTGFQVALEADGVFFVRELNEDVPFPGSPRGSMRAAACVVIRQSCVHVSRETNIEMRTLVCVSHYVDEPLGPHPGLNGKLPAGIRIAKARAKCVRADRGEQFLQGPGRRAMARSAVCRHFGVYSLRVRATGWFTEPNLAEGERRLVIDSPPSRLRRFGAAASACARLAGLPSRSSPKASEGW